LLLAARRLYPADVARAATGDEGAPEPAGARWAVPTASVPLPALAPPQVVPVAGRAAAPAASLAAGADLELGAVFTEIR
jgi:hypothetical protein